MVGILMEAVATASPLPWDFGIATLCHQGQRAVRAPPSWAGPSHAQVCPCGGTTGMGRRDVLQRPVEAELAVAGDSNSCWHGMCRCPPEPGKCPLVKPPFSAAGGSGLGLRARSGDSRGLSMEREKVPEPRERSPSAALGSSLGVPKGTAGHGPSRPRPFPAGPAPIHRPRLPTVDPAPSGAEQALIGCEGPVPPPPPCGR